MTFVLFLEKFKPMRNNNLLTLHEAIAVALLKFPSWKASYEDVAKVIDEKQLYAERQGGVALSKQCFLRAKNYPKLFELVNKEVVRLRCGK